MFTHAGTATVVTDHTDPTAAEPTGARHSIVLSRSRFGAPQGCEATVLALRDNGIRVVIAPSFSESFRNWAPAHRILPAQVLRGDCDRLIERADDGVRLELDAATCTVRAADTAVRFTVDPQVRDLMAAAPPARDVPAAGRTAALQPMRLVELMLLAREHGAVDLASGTPTLPVPDGAVLRAAGAAITEGHNQYENPAGNPALRAAAAALHPGIDPDTGITITAGATEGLSVVLQGLVEPGAEVIVFEPFYEAFPGAVRMAGGIPRYVRLHEPDWRWDPAELRAAFGPRTAAVIVNSPHNPTGGVVAEAAMRELGELCERFNATLICDEAYTDFAATPGRAASESAGVPERTDALRSLSKSHALSGWRIGWIAAPPALSRVFRMVHESLTIGTAAPLQRAAAELLRERPHLGATDRAALRDNQRTMRLALAERGIEVPGQAQSLCYLFARLPEGIGAAEEFVRRLIVDSGVAFAPGDTFFTGATHGTDWIRVSCNKSPESLGTAVTRLAGAARDSAAMPAR